MSNYDTLTIIIILSMFLSHLYVYLNIIALLYISIHKNIIIGSLKEIKLLYIIIKYTNLCIKYNIYNKLIIIFIFLYILHMYNIIINKIYKNN